MVYMFVSVYKLPSTHQKVHNLLRGRTTFSPVPSSTRSVPGTPSLQCWSVLCWRLDPYYMMRALCIVLWLHVFLPHLNTLVWPLPNFRIQVWLQRLFSREKSIQSSRWPKPYLPQIPLNVWEVWGPTHFLPLHLYRVPPGDIQLLFSFCLHIFSYPSHSCHVLWVNGHPGHAFESKVCNIQYMPRLPCFETMQKQTEKFKLYVECPRKLTSVNQWYVLFTSTIHSCSKSIGAYDGFAIRPGCVQWITWKTKQRWVTAGTTQSFHNRFICIYGVATVSGIDRIIGLFYRTSFFL